MKIYDISQEVINCEVYPGDPKPKLVFHKEINQGDLYNLSSITMGSHNGTHIDAPLHFIKNGKSIQEIALEKCVGECFVIKDEALKDPSSTKDLLSTLQTIHPEASKRLLVKGRCDFSKEVAEVLKSEIVLIGSETQSVGKESAPMAVHLELLKEEVVLLEGIRLTDVKEGVYFLSAAPLNLGVLEGAPCRAILIEK